MHAPAWYPDFNKCFVKIFQVCQNKCIWFCLKLNNRDHVGVKEFCEINWTSTKKRSEQCVCPNIFKFFRHISTTCTLNCTNILITATTREGQIADYKNHTDIPFMIMKLFLSQARNNGIIYMLI